MNLVRIVQCTRTSCRHVLMESEYVWTLRSSDDRGIKTAGCPRCGCTVFYTLNEHGKPTPISQHERYRNGIDPYILAPSPRMGEKMRREIMLVRERAIKSLTTTP